MGTLSVSVGTCRTIDYNTDSRWSYESWASQAYRSSAASSRREVVGILHMDGVQTNSPGWSNVGISSMSITVVPQNTGAGYSVSGSTFTLNFWRSPQTSYTQINGSNYVDSSYGVCKVSFPANGYATTTATLSASQIAWFLGAFQKGTKIFSLFPGVGVTSTDTVTFTTGKVTFNITYASLVTKTLSYNANGGSGAPSSQSVTSINSSEKFTIPSTKPTRTNYTFLGWSTSSSATSASYQPGGTISISANTTLYAVWKLNTIHVTFHTGIDQSVWLDIEKDVVIGEEVEMEFCSDETMNAPFGFVGWAGAPYLCGYDMYRFWNDNVQTVWLEYNNCWNTASEYEPLIAGGEDLDLYAVWVPRGNIFWVQREPETLNGWYNNLKQCPVCYNSTDELTDPVLYGISRFDGEKLLPPPQSTFGRQTKRGGANLNSPAIHITGLPWEINLAGFCGRWTR